MAASSGMEGKAGLCGRPSGMAVSLPGLGQIPRQEHGPAQGQRQSRRVHGRHQPGQPGLKLLKALAAPGQIQHRLRQRLDQGRQPSISPAASSSNQSGAATQARGHGGLFPPFPRPVPDMPVRRLARPTPAGRQASRANTLGRMALAMLSPCAASRVATTGAPASRRIDHIRECP